MRRVRPVKEVIVVDGSSSDDTVLTARSFESTIIKTPAGRGQQLRAGGAVATGDVLWFVHADARVPDGAVTAMLEHLEQAPASPGGNFRLLFDGDDDFSRRLDSFYARIRARGSYYGDSGIFVRRSAYEQLGGIRPGLDGRLRFRPQARSNRTNIVHPGPAAGDLISPLSEPVEMSHRVSMGVAA